MQKTSVNKKMKPNMDNNNQRRNTKEMKICSTSL